MNYEPKKVYLFLLGKGQWRRIMSHNYLLLPQIHTTQDQISKITWVKKREAGFHSSTYIIPRILQLCNYNERKGIAWTVSLLALSHGNLYAPTHFGNTLHTLHPYPLGKKLSHCHVLWEFPNTPCACSILRSLPPANRLETNEYLL